MESVWDKATKIIQEKVSKQNFDTWIRPIRIMSMEDKRVQLAVPNKFFKDWLMDNYLTMIKNTLHGVIGINVDIDFMLSKDKEKKTEVAALPFEQSKTQQGAVVLKNKNISYLNNNYTFDRFVVGPSNQFAHAASIAVAKQPAKNYNPLFIYGGSGLGKTHLLNAIGLMTIASHPDL
ncbi:chromosomal replication initiator protein DnaA, partial [bacterium]|nr:chromosomal replication initiator protein DnaA [bacterium]